MTYNIWVTEDNENGRYIAEVEGASRDNVHGVWLGQAVGDNPAMAIRAWVDSQRNAEARS